MQWNRKKLDESTTCTTTKVEEAPKLKIESDGRATSIWINGINITRGVTDVTFAHYSNESSRLAITLDVNKFEFL